MALHYPVDEDKGKAKFDKASKVLTITLPVLPPSANLPPQATPQAPLITPLDTDTREPLATKELDEASTPVDFAQVVDPEQSPKGPEQCLEQSSPEGPELSPGGPEQSPAKGGPGQSPEAPRQSAEGPGQSVKGPGQSAEGPGQSVKGPGQSAEGPGQSAEGPILVGVSQPSQDWLLKGGWLCPPFSYRQEDTVVVFCLHTPHVKENSMVQCYDDHFVSEVF
jgi:dynein assembly factor 2